MKYQVEVLSGNVVIDFLETLFESIAQMFADEYQDAGFTVRFREVK